MGYTNKTTHYELPQYVATDKPKYLTDFNETMVAIDTQMYTNAQAAATADGKAVSAKETADGAVLSIGTLNVQINGDPTDPSDTGLAGDVSGIDSELNTVQSLIGTGHPTTSNQTIIGAINGLEGAVAPREDGDDLANNYSTGKQFARGGSVYEALTSLTADTAFASLTLNTDYKVADTLVEQISDVNAAVSNLDDTYVIKSLTDTVSVDLTNITTMQDAATAILAKINELVSALHDGEVLELESVNYNGIVKLVVDDNHKWTNANTVSNVSAHAVSAGSTQLVFNSAVISSSQRFYNVRVTMADGTITASKYEGTDTIASHNITALNVTYSVYKGI